MSRLDAIGCTGKELMGQLSVETLGGWMFVNFLEVEEDPR